MQCTHGYGFMDGADGPAVDTAVASAAALGAARPARARTRWATRAGGLRRRCAATDRSCTLHHNDIGSAAAGAHTERGLRTLREARAAPAGVARHRRRRPARPAVLLHRRWQPPDQLCGHQHRPVLNARSVLVRGHHAHHDLRSLAATPRAYYTVRRRGRRAAPVGKVYTFVVGGVSGWFRSASGATNLCIPQTATASRSRADVGVPEYYCASH